MSDPKWEVEDRGGYIIVNGNKWWSEGTLRMAEERAEAAAAEIERLRVALWKILRIGERHVDEATGRRIGDFRDALDVAWEALGKPTDTDDAARGGDDE